MIKWRNILDREGEARKKVRKKKFIQFSPLEQFLYIELFFGLLTTGNLNIHIYVHYIIFFCSLACLNDSYICCRLRLLDNNENFNIIGLIVKSIAGCMCANAPFVQYTHLYIPLFFVLFCSVGEVKWSTITYHRMYIPSENIQKKRIKRPRNEN